MENTTQTTNTEKTSFAMTLTKTQPTPHEAQFKTLVEVFYTFQEAIAGGTNFHLGDHKVFFLCDKQDCDFLCVERLRTEDKVNHPGFEWGVYGLE